MAAALLAPAAVAKNAELNQKIISDIFFFRRTLPVPRNSSLDSNVRSEYPLSWITLLLDHASSESKS